MTAEEGHREIARLALEHGDMDDRTRCRLVAAAEPELARRTLGAMQATDQSERQRRRLLAAWDRTRTAG